MIGKPFKDFINASYPKGSVTQWFGENPALYAPICQTWNNVTNCMTGGHNGIDMVAPYGTPLFAVESGTVYEVKEDTGGYGKHVRITTPTIDGKFTEWIYGHLSVITVKKGQSITAGDIIGNMGNSGFVVSNSTANGFWSYNPYAGTHLHLGCRYYKDGVCLNYDNGFMGGVDYRNLLPPYDPINDDISGFVKQVNKLLIILQGAGILK